MWYFFIVRFLVGGRPVWVIPKYVEYKCCIDAMGVVTSVIVRGSAVRGAPLLSGTIAEPNTLISRVRARFHFLTRAKGCTPTL